MTARRAGYVAVVGRPNVGKSTLVNRLVGQKVSITTPRAQTTRHRILGVAVHGDAQIVLVDTPGIHGGGKRALNRAMNRTATQSLGDADLVLFVTEADRFDERDARVLDAIRQARRPAIAVLNKVDRVRPKQRLLEAIAGMQSRHPFADIVPLSARRGDNTERLADLIVPHLPQSPWLFDADAVTDRPLRFMVAEIVREKLTLRLNQELPYGLTVTVDSYDETPEPVAIAATVHVDSPSHKPIVIGRGGTMLKAVGSAARRDIEALIGRRVHLELWVRVRENWSDSDAELGKLGFD